MNNRDDFFQGMRDAALERQEKDFDRDAHFEASVIKAVCKYCGIPIQLRKCQDDALERFGAKQLTMEWVHDVYPAFPIRLFCRKLRFTSGTHIGWTALFGNAFMKLPWMQMYQKEVATFDLDLQVARVGLVFNAPHAKGAGTMVLHNQPQQVGLPDPENRLEPETRIIRPFGHPRVVYVLESLKSFCTTVGNGWAPEG